MKTTLLTFAFALLAFLPHSFAMDKDAHSDMNAATPIKAVMFYSDSCGSCKILDPRISAAMDIINKDKIHMVKLDFSSKETIATTKELAVSEGVNDILQQYGAKTGFVVLVNNAGEEVALIKVDHTTADIAAEMAKAIANAS